jgi:hypothetical protein
MEFHYKKTLIYKQIFKLVCGGIFPQEVIGGKNCHKIKDSATMFIEEIKKLNKNILTEFNATTVKDRPSATFIGGNIPPVNYEKK